MFSYLFGGINYVLQMAVGMFIGYCVCVTFFATPSEIMRKFLMNSIFNTESIATVTAQVMYHVTNFAAEVATKVNQIKTS